MYQIGLQQCQLVILVLSYRSNIFEMQFVYGVDGALQIYQQHVPVALDLVYNIV